MNVRKHKTIVIGLAIALIFVVLGVFLLSNSMETLDKQAEQLGAQEKPVYTAPFYDYTIPGFDSTWGALIIGVISTILLFVVSLLIAKILRKRD